MRPLPAHDVTPPPLHPDTGDPLPTRKFDETQGHLASTPARLLSLSYSLSPSFLGLGYALPHAYMPHPLALARSLS